MDESTKKQPTSENQSVDDRIIDPQDLVYKGGFTGNAREIVENPAVAPQMINPPEHLRDDILESGDEIEEDF
jgi:hypothetical protein